jgi:hypothetical protein
VAMGPLRVDTKRPTIAVVSLAVSCRIWSPTRVGGGRFPRCCAIVGAIDKEKVITANKQVIR